MFTRRIYLLLIISKISVSHSEQLKNYLEKPTVTQHQLSEPGGQRQNATLTEFVTHLEMSYLSAALCNTKLFSGYPGQPGDKGLAGAPGILGSKGRSGMRGQIGSQIGGQPGSVGDTGYPGPKGDPGILYEEIQKIIKKGERGDEGLLGQKGWSIFLPV